MEKIKIPLDFYEKRIIEQLILALQDNPVQGVELERLILIELYERHYLKFAHNALNDKVKFSLKPSEALALKRFLMSISIEGEGHFDRQSIIAKLEPKLIQHERHHHTPQISQGNPAFV